MEDQNVVVMLDKFKKMLELGNKEKVITDMDVTIHMLEKQVRRKDGKIIETIPTTMIGEEPELLKQKINQIVIFINDRFGHA